LIPRLNLELYSALRQSDLPAALRLFRRQLPLLQFIVQAASADDRAGLEIMGIDPGHLRAPLAGLDAARKQELREILQPLI